MSLTHIEHPVQYSFEKWITVSNSISHPSDEERFFVFVKSVYSKRAYRWKKASFLREKILKYNPNFDRERLDRIIDLYPILLRFCVAKPQKTSFLNS